MWTGDGAACAGLRGAAWTRLSSQLSLVSLSPRSAVVRGARPTAPRAPLSSAGPLPSGLPSAPQFSKRVTQNTLRFLPSPSVFLGKALILECSHSGTF